LLGGGGGFPAAHAGGLDLRHELRVHAGTALELRLPLRAGAHVLLGHPALPLFQAEGLALMPTVLWVALGGAIGSAARYGVNIWSGRMLGSEFPWHTFIVNVAGCFAMGALVALMGLKLNVGNETRAFLTTGIL